MNLNCELYVSSPEIDQNNKLQKYQVYFDDELIIEKELLNSNLQADNIQFSVDVESGVHELKLKNLNNINLHILKYIINEEISHNYDEEILDTWSYIINI